MSLINTLLDLQEKTSLAIANASDVDQIETLRTQVFGKKGELTNLLKGMSTLSPEEKPVAGKKINVVKSTLSDLLSTKLESLKHKALSESLTNDTTDATQPGAWPGVGTYHPLTLTNRRLSTLLEQLGFQRRTGPDIESDFYNFEALNIPSDHPARDMHDTFYIDKGYSKDYVLRTHTSPVQIHTLETEAPPVRIYVPGKVYRYDADTTHSPVFHQIEGLFVAKKVTFSDLKGTLDLLLKDIFGAKLETRFRSSYFPFTEPSCEVDVACVGCTGKGCALCKQTGWLEILGAGMVHPNVLTSVKLDPDVYTGFAFGMGIERIAMLLYGIPDIKLFYENDLRFLTQFKGASC